MAPPDSEEKTAQLHQSTVGLKEKEENEPPLTNEREKLIHSGLSVDKYEPKTISLAEFQKMSRNQQKKHMRQELWDATADEFKAKKRQKNKESRKRRRQEQAKSVVDPNEKAMQAKRTQEHSGCRVIIDMDFDDRMGDHEIRSVCSQVGRCYAANRQAQAPVDLHITRLHGKGKDRFDTAMAQHHNWDPQYISMEDSEYIELFAKDQLVYLTADSPNVIESLDPLKAYVIGGIVDKNRYPRLTLDKADAQGITHAQLPIGKYVRMSTRKIMTVNQIFEMLLKFLELGDWEKAFLEIIPHRKFKEGDKSKAAEGSSDDVD
ncbi:tRNA (guanine(9)-N(1))-methyltransferase [Coemansia sp. RSA 1813]|nr:tRNA (guanine(9)-N(1))-methyltransferase [Coemansia sp. RSA 1646]KAJ1765197.1 tRNA (guanine(9)-N(1))-methyltransferase [Coemansia sp. RSA 1843]KAJ2086679.1 tRNA (guanine(9)-N(1))-methyltransferase [Coemansia sp. RSA 986]KAJ2212981.1 tRNA (guanine(9)-N(1))-methyltransferase [Coemansia sp. RSA 487]KAJ2564402.1 tRNA (guanine(9)-N(1))-methyltransferase [Coemansia sp. RSA 1813]